MPVSILPEVASPAWHGTLGPAGVDLIAMLVSDSGLASNDPQWWNCSVNACILIGLQPRGGWQVMQRAVQWGDDHLSKTFGVTCSKPLVYEYFACSIRNRLERWDSPAWISPTEGQQGVGTWQTHVDRPSKLIDGSRGGQAFICDLLLPPKGKSYSIAEQARIQFLSVLLVAAGLINPAKLSELDAIIQEDFQLGQRLGVIFRPLFIGLLTVNALVTALVVVSFYSIFKNNLFDAATPYVVQSTSLILWAVGATGLLILGGNPRVRIVESPISGMPVHISDRLSALESSQSKEGLVKLSFGSIHGSVYTADHGFCSLPFDVAQRICRWDIELMRTRCWKIGLLWWGFCLLTSIALQIVGSQVATLSSTIFSVVILLSTALARGYGVSGSEEWLIPGWKRRMTAAYGASLLGKNLLGKVEARKAG